MTIFETAAASLIWMHRDELLSLDPDEGFSLQVNMQPMLGFSGLMSTILSTMRRIQHDEKPRRT
jgi:hypothetical protein